MKTTPAALASAAIAAASASLISQATAFADQAADPGSHQLGSQVHVTNGNVVQGWTISNLQPSKDTIPYSVQGSLWEATATDEAIQGSVIPIVSNLNARSASGQTYRDLYQVATSQGVNPATLNQGQKTSGKIYFDVTGDKPTSVVYSDGNAVLATWNQPLGGPAASGGGAHSQAVTSPAPANPATKPTPAIAPAGSQGTPLPAGSQGTPLPADNPGAAGTPGTGPAPTGNGNSSDQAGTPVPANGAPAAAGAAGTPLPADGGTAPGSIDGTPVPAAAGTPAANGVTPAPASGNGTPAGSAGTPAS